jgi:antitoxin VapB
MSIGTVFVNNRTQAVRLPMDVRLTEGVQKVDIRVKGKERIIAPPRPKLEQLLSG